MTVLAPYGLTTSDGSGTDDDCGSETTADQADEDRTDAT